MEGRCLCGAVRLTAAGEPVAVRSCWCRACQYIAAGGATTNAFFRTEDVQIDGEICWFESIADSGNTLSRGFCPACGTPLLVQSHARRHLIAIRVGALDSPEAVAPTAIIWTECAPLWACLDPALPHVERQPPPAA